MVGSKFLAVAGVLALGIGSLALAGPAQAIPGTVHVTKTFSSGAGTWTVPADATNITVALNGASAGTSFGVPGKGGAATYSLPNALAGTTLSYLVGAVGGGSPNHPGGSASQGGGGSAIATVTSLLAVVGGGGGGGSGDNEATGGDGGVAQASGVAPGHDGFPGYGGSRAPGQGGQATGGGAASTAAGGNVTWSGQNGEDGPASVSGATISLAMGGFGGNVGGGGGSGYTGGGGSSRDFILGPPRILDYGSGGGGSGYLAASGISYVAASAGTNAGAGSVVFGYDATTLTATSSATVAGFVGQAYSWTPVTPVTGTTPYSYGLSVGSLPAGLSISSSTGAITGTPTGTGTTSFTVLLTDGSGQTLPEAEQITVGLRSIVSPAHALIGGPVNVTGSGFDTGNYTVTIDSVTNSFGTVAVTASGALSFAGTIPSGASAGSHTLEIVTGGLVVASAGITLVPVLTATASTAVAAYQGQSFSWSPVASAGGTAPLSYAITAGALPPGLGLDPATGVISGTPTTAGPLGSAFSVTVTDASASPQSVTVQQQITVGMLTLGTPPSVVQGQTVTITAQGLDQGDYSIELHSTPVVLGTAHVDASGILTFTATVPTGTDPGVHQLVLLQRGIVVATSSITVTAAPARLASTGTDVGGVSFLAMLLLAMGTAIALRRRRSGKAITPRNP